MNSFRIALYDVQTMAMIPIRALAQIIATSVHSHQSFRMVPELKALMPRILAMVPQLPFRGRMRLLWVEQ